MLDPRLLDILACPIDKGPLLYYPAGEFLFNPRLQLRYPVEVGIPVLLAEQSERVEPATHQQLVASAEAGEARATAGASVRHVLASDE